MRIVCRSKLLHESATYYTVLQVASNVKRIYKKEVSAGRVGIEFYAPPHQVLITTKNAEGLSNFLALFHKLMDRAVMERLEYIPILRQFPKTATKPRGIEAAHCVDCDSSSLYRKKPKVSCSVTSSI